MSVDTKHAEYIENKPLWDKVEDCAEGQSEIHEEGTGYLPKLGGQTDNEYRAYKQRAVFYNAVARTIDGLTGMIFLKPPVIEAPAGIDSILNDITMSGLSLHQFAEMVADEVITVGRCGVLVDYPPTENAVTVAQAQSLGMRPYATLYDADNIINWKTSRIANSEQLTLIVLAENYEEPIDEFEGSCKPQWRVLDLFEGAYRQRVFRKTDKDEFILISEIYPQMNGKPITRIPFEFFGIRDNSPCVDKPPLLDLAEVNLSHYRTTADYEHGLHFIGLPTPIITGVNLEQGEKINIGGSSALVFPQPDTKAFFMEFQGQGLGELREALRAKESMMATLGARMLAPEKRAAEAAQTASIHRAGENSVLASISQSVSIGLTHVLERLRDWSGVSGDVKVTLNREFSPVAMTAQDLQALVQSWQAGAISHNSLFECLQSGDIISPDVSFDDEQERIAMNPAGGGLA